MEVGFSLSRQAAPPERIPRPPHPSNTRRHQLPHDLQPQPLAAATFRQQALAAPAPAACEHRPLVLPRLPECPRPDPRSAARRRSLNLAAEPGPAEPGDRHYRFEALEQKEFSHRHDGVFWPQESTGYSSIGSPKFPVVLLEGRVIRLETVLELALHRSSGTTERPAPLLRH